ncbi:MAG: polyamine ABC transporter substrate-binding protein [Gammaproteobacteria bacterium]|nr:polyamine ABC transporter substrate-binding protein [Gammaproteobacteria bacterium]
MKTLVSPTLLVLSVVILLTGCGAKAPPAPVNGPQSLAANVTDDEKLLNVYNWSDYIDPTVVPEFTKETGIEVRYDVFDSNELVETKLLSGSTGYDIVVPSASFLKRQIDSGVFAVLDRSLLPNLKNQDPDITARLALFDKGNAHSVNYLWGTSGVAYNVDKINARMPNAPVNSFSMFYDPRIVSKFKDCGVTILDAPSEVLGTVLIYLGKNPNSEDPEDLAAAEKVLTAIRPYVRYFNSSRYISDLANGEVCLTLGWSGDVLQARTRADEAKKNVQIRYSIPREGAVMFFDMLAVPKDAKHIKNAHLFINFLMRPEIAARNTNVVNYANSNFASKKLINAEILSNPNIYPLPEDMPKLVVDLPKSQKFDRLLTRAWTRIKTGQ